MIGPRDPLICAALRNRNSNIVIDGEAVLLALTAFQTSMVSTVGSTMTKCNPTPSICSSATVMTTASCRPDGLEGLVAKHNDRPYRAGRSPHSIKVKLASNKSSQGWRLIIESVVLLMNKDPDARGDTDI